MCQNWLHFGTPCKKAPEKWSFGAVFGHVLANRGGGYLFDPGVNMAPSGARAYALGLYSYYVVECGFWAEAAYPLACVGGRA